MNPTDVGAVVIDPGAPMEHTREAPAAPASPAKQDTPNPLETRLNSLEAELRETRSNAEYWARRAAGPGPQPVQQVEEEPADEPIVQIGAPPAGESKDDFLNDLNEAGLDALKKRGVITGEQFAQALSALETRLATRYNQDQEGRQFDAKLNAEFPDLVAASDRMAAGQKVDSPLYEKTAAHFKQLIKDSPGVKAESAAGRGLLLAAARLAKADIAMEGNQRQETNDQRRERIDAQPGRGRRAGGADSAVDEGAGLTEQQRALIGNLSRFGVTEDKFRKFAGERPASRNGRG